jgi:adenine-specific DNA-methyltransferase
MPAPLDPQTLLSLVPADSTPIGNIRLRELLSRELGRKVSEEVYAEVRDTLVDRGVLVKGSGRGGSVRRATTVAREDLALTMPEAVERPKPSTTKAAKKGRSGNATGNASDVLSYRHDQKRRNNPEVGMVNPDSDPDAGKTRWAYDPHLDPTLQFDVNRAAIERIIDDALGSGEDSVMREALTTLKRLADPYLNWAGKAERTSFEVDTVSLHVHERIDPATILTGIRRRMTKKGEEKVTQADLFRAWFERPLPYHKAVEFYKHDRGWANRLISGDSLLVMNSLLQKEGMAGQVHMIYLDPPYGIKYGSNFQPFVNKRDVTDRKDEDLTQEPEMIKAFRDTWELGVHSYLTYLRDRLYLAKELLAQTGSIFIQIGDENLHWVRDVAEEVFSKQNFVSLITIKKTIGGTGELLPGAADYVLWFAKEKASIKFREVFDMKTLGAVGATGYTRVRLPNGKRRTLTASELQDSQLLPEGSVIYSTGDLSSQSMGRMKGEGAASWFPVAIEGREFRPNAQRRWSTNESGMARVIKAGRVMAPNGDNLAYVRYLTDIPASPISNVWTDAVGQNQFGGEKMFVVQTALKVVERCMVMTTDPGDLVLDPTCGSGTTAFVAEEWGRRWITCDTSRVAITLTKQRLVTASYDYYELKYPHEGLKAGFVYKTVPHVTLRSIANNSEIDEIWDRMHPAIVESLDMLNAALRASPPVSFEVATGGRKGSQVNFKAKAGAVVLLPSGEDAPAGALLGWEVPMDFPETWPSSALEPFEAFHRTRIALQDQMDVAAAAHAESQMLFDAPQIAKDKLRVTGPFTVEAVPFPSVLVLDQAQQSAEADGSIARSGESARQHSWRDELLKTGIRGKGGQVLRLAQLETLPGTKHLHCTGTMSETGERVVVSFGPEYAALEQRQVELAMREAGELFPRPKMIVFCAFAFDPEAAKDIDATKGITALKAQMNTDLLTEDLKKARASNQSFWLMGQPDVEVRQRKDGRYEVEVNGFDYFDTVKGDLVSGGKGKIAAWSLDTDYDERSLFPRQIFFPMAGTRDGWQKLKKDIKAELDETLLAKLHSTVSLPFEAGENKKVAVKIVDDRGIESLKVIPLS